MAPKVHKISKSGKESYLKVKVKESKALTKKRDIFRTFARRKDTLFEKVVEINQLTKAFVRLNIEGPSGTRYNLQVPEEAEDVTIALSVETNEPVDVPAAANGPFSPALAPKDVECQTAETSFGANIDKDLCRLCAEGALEHRAMWLGCSFPRCDHWVHAKCLGVTCKTKAPLQKLKYMCPRHAHDCLHLSSCF